MIEVAPPDPIVGDLLEQEIADAGVPVERVTLVGDSLRVVGAGEDDRAAVEDVVAAHDPSGYETEWERADREFRDAVSNASSVTDLRDALLGSNISGRVESRPQ